MEMRGVLALGVVLGVAGGARAQEPAVPGGPHARRAEVTFLMQAAVPAVLVSETAVWAPQLPAGQEPLSICAAGRRCVPVAAVETCAVPACPGAGARLVAASPIREDVDDFPDSLDDWKTEIEAMRLDPMLAPMLASYVSAHPDEHPEEPILWVTDDDEEELRAELRIGVLGGGLATQGAAVGGAEIAAAMRLIFNRDDDYEDDSEDVLETALGDSAALELRFAAHDIPNEQGDGRIATSLGAGLSASNVMDGGRFRISSVLSALLPELGVFFRPGYTAAFYMRLSAPIAYAVSNTFALELRPSITIIDAWAEGEQSEVMLGASVATIIR